MRKILFRGKRVDNDEWVYGSYVYYEHCPQHTIYENEDIDGDGITEPKYKLTTHEVIKETVGQFTGVVDKNGMKIFEGDIIKAKNIYNGTETVGKTYYEDYQWFSAGDYMGYLIKNNEIEVIGNIHDNKELL